MILRILLSLAVFTVAGYSFWDNVDTLVQGRAIGWQLNPSDTDYLMSMGVSDIMHSFRGYIGLASVVIVGLIWYPWIKRQLATLAVLTVLSLGIVHPAKAYYAQNDYSEVFVILPNESAFWIPAQGDNKNSQAKFGSEEYYNANKVPAKRFIIEHQVKLPNSGVFANMYVSPGMLIKVDRAPTTREWVENKEKGTSGKAQGFPCQSKEGLDVTTGVSIGTSVTEENAAKFLYNFGVNPPGYNPYDPASSAKVNPNDPQVVFTTLYYGKSLHEVMDEKVRNKVQALVCDQMTKHTLLDANEHAADMMKDIEKEVRLYLDSVGITLDFIGWADTFDFSNEVQGAIDRAFVADAEAKIAQKMAPNVATMQGLAEAEAIRKLGDKWDGHLPSQVTMWGDLMGMFSKVLGK